VDDLAEELGAEPPEGLTPAQRERLAGEIRRARREQRIALAEASERALDHVPRLLRGIVRRVSGG
jgi:hypothetical protein